MLTKANDAAVVHVTGIETIAGTKTFQDSPVVPTPTATGHATTKGYVDSTAASGTPDATSSVKGKLQLAGDLAGTASAPTVPTAVKKGELVFRVGDYGGVTDKQKIIAAFAAAEAAGGRRIVLLPPTMFDVGTGLSLAGYSSVLQGTGAGYDNSGAIGSGIRATAQTGPVLDLNGWICPNNFYGKMTFAGFAIEGDNTADATLTKTGLTAATNGTAIGSTTFEDISITKTGSPALDLGISYLCDYNRVVLGTPVSAKANNVPWMRTRGMNGNRFVGLGFRSLSASADVGVIGAIDMDSSTTDPSESNVFYGTWFEYLHVPTNGTLWSIKANNSSITDTYFVDCGKEIGATGTSVFRLSVPSFSANYGGNIIRGNIPGNGGAADSFDTGIEVQQNRNRIEGVRGYASACVTIASGVDYTWAQLGGAESGVAGASAFVNNSTALHNTLIDGPNGIDRMPTYNVNHNDGQGPRFEDTAVPARGSVWLGNSGANMQAASGNLYHSLSAAGSINYRVGFGTPFVVMSSSFAPAIKAVSGTAGQPDIEFGSGTVGARFGTTGPQLISGSGTPQGVITAPPGSLYLNSSGGTGATFWAKESGSGNTGWVAK